MTKTRHHGLIGELRRDLALFARVCLLILAVPVFYPLAQAQAAGDGAEIICTRDGSAVLADGGDLALHALDDCPCGVLCPMQGVAIPPLQQIALPAQTTADAGPVPAPHAEARAPPSLWLHPPGRAPPFIV